jgi:hypothetical protein
MALYFCGEYVSVVPHSPMIIGAPVLDEKSEMFENTLSNDWSNPDE